jgi:hypothetical protein
MFFLSCNEGPGKDSKDQAITNVKSNNAEINFELQPLLKQRASKTVKVLYDDYFKSSKEYVGYEILPIIDSIIKSKSFDTTNSTIIFECTDGYKPTMPLARLYDRVKPYIVYKDLDEKGNKNWPDSIESKFRPYYLVWDAAKKEDHSFVWPYGLVSITLKNTDLQNKSIYPVSNAL